MVCSPIAVSNEFIELAGQVGLTHMQIQKLVYLAHEEWLKEKNTPFLSENPQVWQFGPVFADLYHQLKHYKKALIKEPIQVFDFIPKVDDQDVKQKIASVWEKYKGKSGVYLSDLTHMPGTPWRNIAKKYNFSVPYGLEITPKDIISAVR